MRIAVYGGTFDPIHNGHLTVARGILTGGYADRVLLIVNQINPLKTGLDHSPASFADRLAMAQMATAGIDGVEVSDIESRLPLPSYTVNTLEALQKERPGDTFRLVIGSDNVAGFHRWRDADRLLHDFGVLVYPRPGYVAQGLPAGMEAMHVSEVRDVSSTGVRSGECHDVPPAVAAYIAEHGLYGR